MSGLPGTRGECRRYLKPLRCRALRIASSSRVFLARMPAIILLRVAASTTSGTCNPLLLPGIHDRLEMWLHMPCNGSYHWNRHGVPKLLVRLCIRHRNPEGLSIRDVKAHQSGAFPRCQSARCLAVLANQNLRAILEVSS